MAARKCQPHDHPPYQEDWEHWPCPRPGCPGKIVVDWRHETTDRACKHLHYSDQIFCPACLFTQGAFFFIRLNVTRGKNVFCHHCNGNGYRAHGERGERDKANDKTKRHPSAATETAPEAATMPNANPPPAQANVA